MYSLIFTPTCLAVFLAPGANVVLNASIVELLASAKSTSVSVISPGDAYNTLTLTFSSSICSILLIIASTDPCISVLIIRFMTASTFELRSEYLSDVEFIFWLLLTSFFLICNAALASFSSL